MRDLSVTLIQCELAWEQPEDNRQQIGNVIDRLEEATHLLETMITSPMPTRLRSGASSRPSPTPNSSLPLTAAPGPLQHRTS